MSVPHCGNLSCVVFGALNHVLGEPAVPCFELYDAKENMSGAFRGFLELYFVAVHLDFVVWVSPFVPG